MSTCNRCHFEEIKRRAGADGKRWKMAHQPLEPDFPVGVVVVVYPPGATPFELEDAGPETNQLKWFSAWFAEMSSNCEC